MIKQADAIVVGGGSTGAAILCALARAGIKNSVLIERGALAAGPTGRSPAILRQHYGHPELIKMARYGIEYFRSWREHTQGDCDYVRTPLLSTVGQKNAEAFDRTLHLMRDCGAQIDKLSLHDVEQFIPGVALDDVVAASLEPDAGYCDPHATAWSYTVAARQLGAQVLQATTVTGVMTQGERVIGVRTDSGDIASPIVIFAAGPWTMNLMADIGVYLPLTTVRHSLAQLALADGIAEMDFLYADYITGLYLRPEGHRQILAGSLLPADNSEQVDPDRFNEGVTQELFISLAERIVHRFPLWSDIGDAGGWSSLLDMTPDGYPLLGKIDAFDGLHVAAGLSGHGFKLCQPIAEIVTATITGQSSQFDGALFAANRFEQHGPIKDLTSYRYDAQPAAFA